MTIDKAGAALAASDLALIKAMVAPLAAKAGVLRGRVMAMITEAAIRDVYKAVGRNGVYMAAAAIVRIGETKPKEVIDSGSLRER